MSTCIERSRLLTQNTHLGQKSGQSTVSPKGYYGKLNYWCPIAPAGGAPAKDDIKVPLTVEGPPDLTPKALIAQRFPRPGCNRSLAINRWVVRAGETVTRGR